MVSGAGTGRLRGGGRGGQCGGEAGSKGEGQEKQGEIVVMKSAGR